MSVQKLIYGEFTTDSLITALTNDTVFPLIRELHHHYGLKVLEHKHEYQRVGPETSATTFYLVEKNGFAQGHVYAWEEDAKTHYAYYTPFASKDRGKSDIHRQTWTSHKLSSLMGALKKGGVIKPDVDLVLSKLRRAVDGIKHQAEGHFGKTYKSLEPFTGDEVHQMLKTILLGAPLFVDRSKCQTALDKYNEIDSNLVERNREITRMFENPFYLIAADKRGHCMVGKGKRVKDGNDPYKIEIVQDFQRMSQDTLYSTYPDLIPILTMAKVAYEGSGHTMVTPFMPRSDKYDENLDVVYYYPKTVSEYHEQWMMIPIGWL
jgi:hypothetical protein